MYYTLQKNSFCLKANLLSRFLPLGISSFLTRMSIVVIMGVRNTTLVRYGAQSVYGAGNRKRVRSIFKTMMPETEKGEELILNFARIFPGE